MNPINSIFDGVLKSNKYSITKQRKLIFDKISELAPVSLFDLINSLKEIDRSTIYRTIDLFIKLRLIKKIDIGFKYNIELSELFSKHHHHFYCSKCHQIIDFDEPSGLEELIYNLANKYNFKSSEHSLEINGLCSNCQQV
ncbi:MAG: transcriptional repressor [Patescibacteria group bacterium]|jgi:Fe2+ or Zn2+ uptake regulation protein|nr:transcriptional repressor [Patescibacteria group bacterium]